MRAMPSHIQGKRDDCTTNLRMDLGLKSWISPMLFIARLTHSSPAVPPAMIRKNKITSRTFQCSAGRGLPYKKNTQTNHQNSKQAKRGVRFSEKKEAKKED